VTRGVACRTCEATVTEASWTADRRSGAARYRFALVGWRCPRCGDVWADPVQRSANEASYARARRVREAD
jgi:ribosomal protein L37AE/L43A